MSENTTIDPDKMLGGNVTVGMSLPDSQWRYFNGYVARFGQHETLYGIREYCVQYRETDFNFIGRLLEEEGIYFYFIHENGKHHLVLADSTSAHDKFPGYEKIPYHSEQGGTDKSRTDHIHEWVYSRSIQSGTHVLTDYDFKKPKANLLVQSAIKMPHTHAG
ncbi:MAG: phage late control D family protein [Proteobacteria bacterium]|nr:phage late control D family protein [Pseudomonadota bacterium]